MPGIANSQLSLSQPIMFTLFFSALFVANSHAISSQPDTIAEVQSTETTTSKNLPLEELLLQIDIAANSLDEMPSPVSPQFNIDDWVSQSVALQTIHRAAYTSNPSWKLSTDLQSKLENLIQKSIEYNIQTGASIASVFHAIQWLPITPNTPDIVMKALDISKGNPQPVWSLRLHEYLTESHIIAIRVHILNEPNIANVMPHEIAILAINGSNADRDTLWQLATRATQTERTHTRLPSGRRSKDILLYVQLQDVRHAPDSLLQWAFDAPGFGKSADTIWAIEEVLSLSNADADILAQVWAKVEQISLLRFTNYQAIATNIAVSSEELRLELLANQYRPWAAWANGHGYAIPMRITEILQLAPQYGQPSIN